MSVQETIERSHRTNGVFEVAVPQPGVSDEAAPGEADGAGATKTTTGTSRRSAAAPARARRRMPQALKRWGIRLFAILVAIALWDYLTVTDFHYVMNFENVPEPLVVAKNLIAHLQTEKFYIHILVSLRRILIGYSFAVVLGIVIGLLMGRSKLAEDFFIPYIEILRPIPAVAWIPLAILMWPTEESSIIYITFLGAFFPIVINTVHGAEQTPAVLVRAAQSLGASPVEIFWHVVIPAALPSIAAGLSIGMGVSWFSLLAGEIISGQYGIGYFTWNAYSLIEYPNIVVGMLVIGGLGTASTYLVKLATKPLLRWQKAEQGR